MVHSQTAQHQAARLVAKPLARLGGGFARIALAAASLAGPAGAEPHRWPFIGQLSSAGSPAAFPGAILRDTTGPAPSTLVIDRRTNRIFRIQDDGTKRILAGPGAPEPRGEPGQAGAAAQEPRLNRPSDLALGPDGAIFVADTENHCIFRIDRKGVMATFAGTGRAGFNGDRDPDGQPRHRTETEFNRPTGVAVAPDGALLVADSGNFRLRRISPEGQVETLAGNGHPETFQGQGDRTLSYSATGTPISPTRVTVTAKGRIVFNSTGPASFSADDAPGESYKTSTLCALNGAGEIETLAGMSRREVIELGLDSQVPKSWRESPSADNKDHLSGRPARELILGEVTALTSTDDQEIVFTDNLETVNRLTSRIRKLALDGRLHTVGGGADADHDPDRAMQVWPADTHRFNALHGVAVLPGGGWLFTESPSYMSERSRACIHFIGLDSDAPLFTLAGQARKAMQEGRKADLDRALAAIRAGGYDARPGRPGVVAALGQRELKGRGSRPLTELQLSPLRKAIALAAAGITIPLDPPEEGTAMVAGEATELKSMSRSADF